MPDPITPEERARWRELDEKATEGPWTAENTAHHYWILAENYVAKVISRGGLEAKASDAALIAEYRTAVPRLLDEIERLEAEKVARINFNVPDD